MLNRSLSRSESRRRLDSLTREADSLTKEVVQELLDKASVELTQAIEKLLRDTASDLKEAWKEERADMMQATVPLRRSRSSRQVDQPQGYESEPQKLIQRMKSPSRVLNHTGVRQGGLSHFVRPGGKRAMLLGTITKGVEKTGYLLSKSTSSVKDAVLLVSDAAANAAATVETAASATLNKTKSSVSTAASSTLNKTLSFMDGIGHHSTPADRDAPNSSPRSENDPLLSPPQTSEFESRSGSRPVLARSGTLSLPNTPKKPGRQSPNSKLNDRWESSSEESEDDIISQSTQKRLSDLLKSKAFQILVSCLILLNAIVIGCETDYMARNAQSELPIGYLLVDAFTCVCFVIEMVLRLYTFRCGFFCASKSWKINVFDLFCVLAQVVELLLAPFHITGGHMKYQNFLTFIRILRLLRLFRVTHIMHHSETSEVRKIIVSISHSMKPLFWTLVVIVAGVYVVGICLTQLVTSIKVDIMKNRDSVTLDDDHLEEFFGTLPRSIMSLYEAVSEGIHWHELVTPLRQHCNGTVINILFSLYMAFMIFVMMNVITGHIVECAIEVAEDDKKRQLLKSMRRVFQAIDTHHTGIITWEDFRDHLQHNEETKNFLKEIDIDTYEAISLFSLLDKDNSNEILAEDLVEGCTRLRGTAKVSHVMRFMEEWQEHADYVEKSLEVVMELANGRCQEMDCTETEDINQDQAQNGEGAEQGPQQDLAEKEQRQDVMPL